MKAVVAAFNQEKALVGAFSVITKLRMELGCNFLKHWPWRWRPWRWVRGLPRPGWWCPTSAGGCPSPSRSWSAASASWQSRYHGSLRWLWNKEMESWVRVSSHSTGRHYLINHICMLWSYRRIVGIMSLVSLCFSKYMISKPPTCLSILTLIRVAFIRDQPAPPACRRAFYSFRRNPLNQRCI